MESFRARRGYTIIELLTVTAVISMLIALLFPALQSARSSARRVLFLRLTTVRTPASPTEAK